MKKRMIGNIVKVMVVGFFVATLSLTVESCSGSKGSVRSTGNMGYSKDRNSHVWGKSKKNRKKRKNSR